MITFKHHKTLTPEKWLHFRPEQRILMIANELQRILNGRKSMQATSTIQEAFERAFELIDITVETSQGSLRKELLRLREVLGEQYLLSEKNATNDSSPVMEKLLKVLILMNGTSAKMLAIA